MIRIFFLAVLLGIGVSAHARMNPIIRSCDTIGYWDIHGNRYNANSGRYFRAYNETLCTRVRNTLNCEAG